MEYAAPIDVAALEKAVTDLLKDQRAVAYAAPENIKYSAFTRLSRCTVFPAKSRSYDILNEMGSAFVRYRAWGNDRGFGYKILNGETPSQIFQDDHDWFRPPSPPPGFTHPHRIVFGLPHAYSPSKVWGNETRRASPLFFHVHKTPAGQYFGLMFDLRSEFLAPSPTGGPATIKDPMSGIKVPVTPDWSMLDELHNGVIPISRFPRSKSRASGPIPLADGIKLTKIF